MGIYKNGILGGFSGKVGTVIGSYWKGRNVMRAVPAHVNNPNTPLQQAARARFALVGRFVAACQGFVNVGYANQSATITAGNAAVHDNFNNGAIQGTGTNVSLDYTRVSLSSGSHINPESPAATQGTGHTIAVSWTDNTDPQNPVVIYAANSQFRWSGTTYVPLTDGSGFSAITDAEIDAICV